MVDRVLPGIAVESTATATVAANGGLSTLGFKLLQFLCSCLWMANLYAEMSEDLRFSSSPNIADGVARSDGCCLESDEWHVIIHDMSVIVFLYPDVCSVHSDILYLLIFVLYTVIFVVYILIFVLCTLIFILCILISVLCIVLFVLYMLIFVLYTVIFVLALLYLFYALWYLFCALWYVFCTVWYLFCTLWYLLCTFWYLFCTLIIVLYTLIFVLYAVIFVLYILIYVLYILIFVLCILIFVLCILIFVLCTLIFVLYTVIFILCFLIFVLCVVQHLGASQLLQYQNAQSQKEWIQNNDFHQLYTHRTDPILLFFLSLRFFLQYFYASLPANLNRKSTIKEKSVQNSFILVSSGSKHLLNA